MRFKGLQRGIPVRDTPLSGRERRMVLRLLEFWREARAARSYPHPADLDEAAMPELWPFCIVFDVTQDRTDPVIVQAGRTISSFAAEPLAGRRASQFDKGTLPYQAVAYLDEVLQKEVPISRGGSFVDPRGVTILYRSIVVPASENGTTVTTLIAAANCREVTQT